MLAAFAASIALGCHTGDGIGMLRVPPPPEALVALQGEGLLYTHETIAGPLDPGFEWDELIPSWNLPDARMSIRLDVALSEPGEQTRWYAFGVWTKDPAGVRQSVKDQKDEIAEVQTDTLAAHTPQRKVWVRIRLSAEGQESLKVFPFVALSFKDTRAQAVPEPPNKKAWGTVMEVPRKSQLSYEGGRVWCSPTCVSMMLGHWAKVLRAPDLERDVPEAVEAIFDPNWPGTGNWPFNTAYAGSFPPLRAYVARLGTIVELEDWIAAGVPVVVSVSSAMLKGKPAKEPNDGHLVVLVGFTKSGDPICNDPGWSVEIRQVYRRDDFKRAWAASKNTVYLIYPQAKKPPPNRLGHWLD